MVFKPLIDREREVRAVLFGTAVAPLAENLSASLWDMGDNVLYAQLQASMVPGMNPVDDHVLSMLDKARNFLAGGRFQALVVGGKGKNFSVGAQLAMVLELAKAKQWKVIEFISGMLQDINLSFRHAAYPVVVAPHGLTLGGGMEIALGGRRRVVHAEFYGGLVEVGVGLIPAGGGCTLLLKQFIDSMASKKPGPMVPVQAAFELIGFGKVSNSADNAIDLGLLDLSDVVVRNQDELLLSAKKVALGMVDGFQPLPKDPLWLPGEAGYLAMTNAIDGMVRSGKISDHSAEIARVQAFILTGGNRAKPSAAVSVDDMLALEREGFVKLCAMDATQERMAYMLKTGKPLIN
ncbi:MAG: hypothetical protein A2284_00770 [Deltaproteobacteria bacterium RIFOXYA12_FULL_61_11]|nr:MAG: hypothetical protein A2284_00770 [Deltaproteobacteria bacterium RIFOXYA12_FULL_61_11]